MRLRVTDGKDEAMKLRWGNFTVSSPCPTFFLALFRSPLCFYITQCFTSCQIVKESQWLSLQPSLPYLKHLTHVASPTLSLLPSTPELFLPTPVSSILMPLPVPPRPRQTSRGRAIRGKEPALTGRKPHCIRAESVKAASCSLGQIRFSPPVPRGVLSLN